MITPLHALTAVQIHFNEGPRLKPERAISVAWPAMGYVVFGILGKDLVRVDFADQASGEILDEADVIPIQYARVQGTPFQLKIWQALRQVELGTTLTYGDLARSIGHPTAARAVGSAVGANPLSILIPCHRVVARGGALGGYHWGLDRKRRLLALEGV
ncbi:MAG: methylated-DNA--[protein]-cysteine S-methyltransferase [Holosporales bacterium]